MAEPSQFPAISQQVTELVLAGSSQYAEEAFNDAAEQFGDVAVVTVLDSLEPQVTAMHLTAFDGGKLSLATLLISPKAWADSLAFFAAQWSVEMIEDEPELLAKSLFAHIHGILFSNDDAERRAALIHHALANDWGTTAFAVVFSTAIEEIVELANDIYHRGAPNSGQTNSDHDVIPLALEIAQTDIDAWERVLFEIFPDWQPGENHLQAKANMSDEDEEHEHAFGRTTQELLVRLRKQVPSSSIHMQQTTHTKRPSLGEDIFE